jgi:hypothetical protein
VSRTGATDALATGPIADGCRSSAASTTSTSRHALAPLMHSPPIEPQDASATGTETAIDGGVEVSHAYQMTIVAVRTGAAKCWFKRTARHRIDSSALVTSQSPRFMRISCVAKVAWT